MENLLSTNGSEALDVLGLSVVWFSAALVFFSVKNKNYGWLHYGSFGSYVLLWLVVIARDSQPLHIKLFATLLLISLITVAVVVRRRKKMETS